MHFFREENPFLRGGLVSEAFLLIKVELPRANALDENVTEGRQEKMKGEKKEGRKI
jgi:hypothetical protein